ncbi:MAG: hypothetical protein OEY36_10895 [Gammaproteobacteria bacterium]|nr:hypothetical protein [Gammaproteobacteria bacterium]
MKALLITPETQSVESVEINHIDDIKNLIGFETIESDEIDDNGDRLYFDEECFLRGSAGRFQIDSIIPVSGKGVIIGSANAANSLADIKGDIENIKSRIQYLS